MKKLFYLLLFPIVALGQVQFGGHGDLVLTGASGLTATVNNILPNGATSADGTDMSGYASALVQVVSTGTAGTFIFEGSNFLNTNYQTIPVWNQATATGTPITAAITATASQIGYWIPKKFRFIRLRIATTITGGTLQAVTVLHRQQTHPNYFQVAQATAANLQTTVTGTVISNLGTGGTVATSIGKAEDAAHASGDTGPAVWGVRYEALTAPSAAGDYTFIQVDELGKVVMMPYAPSVNHVQGINATAITGTGDTPIITAGAAGVRNYITSATFVNTSATATEIQIKDGTTIIWRGWLPANGGLTVTFPTPLRSTAATAINVACVTTATNTFATLTGYRAL
jgi:hypothetical protein